jgi:hypothetical protein
MAQSFNILPIYRAETQLVSKIKGQVAPDVQVGLEALNESFNGQEFSKTYKLKKTEVRLTRLHL